MSPSGSAVELPITRLAQVVPLSKVTFTERPAGTSARDDIVTTFDGSVGLTAIASSASLPVSTLESKFAGGGAAAASPVMASASASPTTTVSHLDLDITLPLPQSAHCRTKRLTLPVLSP